VSAAGTRSSALVAVVVVVAGMVLTVAAVRGLFAILRMHVVMTSSGQREWQAGAPVPVPRAK
jgi:hypothetical protein